jgi:peptidoglycan hydrolase CwlO-like protein
MDTDSDDGVLRDLAVDVMGLIDQQKEMTDNLKEIRKSLKQKSAKLVGEMQRLQVEEVCNHGRVIRLNTEMKVALVE